jgi:hypothetical protein
VGRSLALAVVVAGAAAVFGVVILQDKEGARPPQDRARAPEDRARPPHDRSAAPRVRADFETGDLSQWQGRFTPVSLGTGTADITVVRSPVKQGNYAARVGARTEEQTGAQQGTSRSELVRSTNVTGNKGFPVNLTSNSTELWTRWSMYIPSSTVSQLPTDCTVGADGCGITILRHQPRARTVLDMLVAQAVADNPIGWHPPALAEIQRRPSRHPASMSEQAGKRLEPSRHLAR